MNLPSINSTCPHCGTRISSAKLQHYWRVSLGLRARGHRVRIKLSCCENFLTKKHLDEMLWNNSKSVTAWGRAMSAKRQNHGHAGGRPKGSFNRKLKRCSCRRQTLRRALARGKSVTDHDPGCEFYP
jgi:hypothetical protein